VDCGAGAWGGESHEVGRKGDEARERRQGWKASKAGAEEEGVRFRRRDGIGKGNRRGGGSFCSFRLSAGFVSSRLGCCVNRQGIGNRNGLRNRAPPDY
jgi:hypothetical protein